MDVNGIWTPYCGVAPVPAELMYRWNLDPYLLLGFAALPLLIWWLHQRCLISVKRPQLIVAAYCLAVLIFISPFCALASALFSVRVAHHIILAGMIAPMLVLSVAKPQEIMPSTAIIAGLIHAVIFWAWHFPPIYEAALSLDLTYWFMQALLVFSAGFVWHSVSGSSPPFAILVLLFTTLQMGLLGALLTFATAPMFEPHLLTTATWGFSSLEDQQLAGGIMWVAGSGIYLIAALVVFHGLINDNRKAKC